MTTSMLNHHSKDGWELIQIASGVESDAGKDDGNGIFITRFYFKRAKKYCDQQKLFNLLSLDIKIECANVKVIPEVNKTKVLTQGIPSHGIKTTPTGGKAKPVNKL